MPVRPVPLALALAVLSGCVSSRPTVDAPAERVVTDVMIGGGWRVGAATLWVVEDSARLSSLIDARDLYVRRDSTSWVENDGRRRTVPTEQVEAFEAERRQTGVGALTGLGVGLAAGGFLLARGIESDRQCQDSGAQMCGLGVVLAAVVAVPATLIPTILGAVGGSGQRRTVRYVRRGE